MFINHGDAANVYLLLHEIGHALGFKHPFDGNPTLPKSLDNHANTIMSYTGNYPNVLGRFDKEAVAAVYGGAATDGASLTSWTFDVQRDVLTRIGSRSDDKIYGVSVSDVMDGRGGADLLAGFRGDDRLTGGNGRDTIFGGDGADRISGGGGRDDLYGEAGNDSFVFVRLARAFDTIHGFSDVGGNNDVVEFDSAVFGLLGRGEDGLGLLKNEHFLTSAWASTPTASTRFIYDRPTGTLFFDADGSGVEPKVAIATFTGFISLSASDILIA